MFGWPASTSSASGRRRAAEPHHQYARHLFADHRRSRRGRAAPHLVRAAAEHQDNAGAVAARDSVAATFAVCARASPSNSARTAARPGSPTLPNSPSFDTALTGPLGQRRPGALVRVSHTPVGTVASYWVCPADINTATLDRLWAPDTDPHRHHHPTAPRRCRTVDVGAAGALRTPPVSSEARLPTGLQPLPGRHDLAIPGRDARPGDAPLLAPHRRLRWGRSCVHRSAPPASCSASPPPTTPCWLP